MVKIYVISDTHFGHENSLKWTDNEGNKLRPFNTVEELNNTMITNWNNTVNEQDHVYHLGDVVINKKYLELVKQLKGHKRLCLGNHDCLSWNTECLTRSGWKNYKDLLITDLVLSLNKDGICSWNPINKIFINDNSKTIFNLKCPRLKMSVTPNHRVLLVNKKNEIYYTLAKDLKGKVIFKSSAFSSLPEYKISDSLIKLLAWIYTDSCIHRYKGIGKYITIYQSKEDMVNEITNLLDELNLIYRKTDRLVKPKGTLVCGKKLIKDSLVPRVITITSESSKDLLELINYNKNYLADFIFDFSDRQTNIFVKEVIKANGSWATNGLCQSAVVHGRKEFLDSLQMLCVQKGINSFISVAREKDYRLNLNFNSTTRMFDLYKQVKDLKWIEEEYDKESWCIETPLTNFMVRREGSTFFTGNCFPNKLYYEAGFKELYGVRVFPGLKAILTHIPIHPDCIKQGWINVIGHLHSNVEPDRRYINVSVEQINYTPVLLEDILQQRRNEISY